MEVTVNLYTQDLIFILPYFAEYYIILFATLVLKDTCKNHKYALCTHIPHTLQIKPVQIITKSLSFS